jgi:predicted RNase H-like HicB family nuclease
MAAVSERAYRVVVTREDGQWLADVPELQGAHTYARSLPTLDQAVREVIVLAADLPDETMPDLLLDYDYHTGDPELDTTALEVRRLRREAAELAAAAAARTGEVAAQLVARGLSVRDVASLLGISRQRVSQLTFRTSRLGFPGD